jgi:hypothetical protein
MGHSKEFGRMGKQTGMELVLILMATNTQDSTRTEAEMGKALTNI